MVQFDNQYRQIKVKIVYYGPALGGKTTCLQHVHRVADPQRRTKLYSLNTASDRTLFFDLLSLNLGRIRGYRLAIQLYTVPGQVQYNATRRAVLSGADGVVFVADSQLTQRQLNLASLANLKENLEANGLTIESIPMVLQYNKRDLDQVMGVADLERQLNTRGLPSFPTVATTGEGVMEAFAAIANHTLTAVADRLGVGGGGRGVQRLQEQVQQALRPFLVGGRATVDADEVAVTTPAAGSGADEVLGEDTLVAEAVRANMAMTDLNAQLDTLGRQLERKIRMLAGVAQKGRALSNEREPHAVLRSLVEGTIDLLGVPAAAVLTVPRSGPLRETFVHGMEQDPLLARADGTGEPLALGLLEAGQPRLLAADLEGSDGDFHLEAIHQAGFSSAVVVPLAVPDRLIGLLTAYGAREGSPLEDDHLQVATALAATAAMAHATSEAWSQLEQVNRGLEEAVAQRTEELEKSLSEVRQLATDLEERNSQLAAANDRLGALDRFKDDLMERLARALRAPVSSVANAARLLAEEPRSQGVKGGRYVDIIREQAERLSELMESMEHASLLSGNDLQAARRAVPVKELLRRVVTPLRDLAQKRRIKLNILVPSSLGSVLCEPSSTEAALRALMKNAIEFNREGGVVKLELRQVRRGDTQWVTIRVVDTGTGIAEEDLPRVFDSFWQGPEQVAERPRGLGLGLTIAKRVAEAHGGNITVVSPDREGVEVTAWLPQDAR